MFIDEPDLREQSRKKLAEVLTELKARGRLQSMPKTAENLCMSVVWDLVKIEAGCDTTQPGTSPAHIMLHTWAAEVSKGPDPWQMGEKQILITILDEWAEVLIPLRRKKSADYDFELEAAYTS